MGYRVKFARISRNHNVQDLSVHGTADQVAEQIYRYAKPKVASRDVEVVVNLEELYGTIYCGMQVGGNFTLEPVS